MYRTASACPRWLTAIVALGAFIVIIPFAIVGVIALAAAAIAVGLTAALRIGWRGLPRS